MNEDDPSQAPDLPAPREPKVWPVANPPEPGEGIACVCGECGQPWNVHASMASFRLRCICGAWVDVPAPVQDARPTSEELIQRNADVRLPDRYRDPAEPLKHEVSTQTAMPSGSLRHATRKTRQRWTDRAVLELALVMGAFLGPQLVVFLTTEGREQALAWPIASLISALLITAICLGMARYSLSGLRNTAGRFYAEVLGVTAVTVGLAILWSNWVLDILDENDSSFGVVFDELGFGWAILLIAVFPAIFEELAFRGLLQPRLMALLGHKEGILAAGTAFALAHGITVGLPFHFFLGVYLGYLRDRSGSLLPCMLMHFLYNGSLVWYHVG